MNLNLTTMNFVMTYKNVLNFLTTDKNTFSLKERFYIHKIENLY